MRKYELRGKGLDTLTLVERPVPRVGPGQILVRMRAVSLNYRDLLIAQGRYERSEIVYPLVPLSDGAGEVIAVGPDITRLHPHDRVMGAFFQKWIDGPFGPREAESALGGAIDGVLSEYIILEEAAALRVPADLSFEEAATLPCAGLSAWVGLVEFGAVADGETVLAMGTGGVSIFALQLAKRAGASVILTSSSDEKLERGRALGADECINYRTTPDWAARVREITRGRGVDHILEVGGKSSIASSLRAVREGGHIALVGLLGGEPADLASTRKQARAVRLDSVYVGSVRHFERLNDAVARWDLHPVVDRVFSFDEAPEAFRYLESGAHFGKVVIRV
jgi:NADPH:quinone reductase-like Zn-dependent oxidoreductase